ncbi:hypothetical protein GGE65_004157 [Skermanella aerolata]|uniref:hypothetical protein n=1 Tax=Skermanella aerolata TaxID=393310 RepID=UPI003D226BE0
MTIFKEPKEFLVIPLRKAWKINPSTVLLFSYFMIKCDEKAVFLPMDIPHRQSAVIHCPAPVKQRETHHTHGGGDHQAETSDRHVDPEGVEQDAQENDHESGKRLWSLDGFLNLAEAIPIHSLPSLSVSASGAGKETCLAAV